MKAIIKVILVCILSVATNCKEICYDNYGCFTDEYPFGNSTYRPVSLLPQSPEIINTHFYLYNHETDKNMFTVSDISSKFNPNVPTKFIIHGFFNSAQMGWIIDMKKALLNTENMNVIAVDWSGGSGLPYTQATSNTQVVGVEVSILVKALIKKFGMSAASFHCIGHSLGAHICGYAGKRIQLGRISGMDPAGPYFENTPEIVRLSKNDADFVDIIHTNGKKLVGDTTSIGMLYPLGHVDFYPNGGEVQPGCWITDGNIMPHCSHVASALLYIDSIIKKCALKAYPCSSTDDYYSGDCLKCGQDGCNTLGYYSSPSKDTGSLYLDTQSIYADNRCKQNYQVTVNSDDMGDKKAKGKFTIYFQTSNQKSSTETLENGSTVFASNLSKKYLISLDRTLSEWPIVSAFIVYKKGWSVFTSYEDQWQFKSIEVYSADQQSLIRLCPVENFFDMSNEIEYTNCQ